MLYEDGKYAGIMFIQGVATYDEAVAKTKLHFGGAVELVLSSGDPDMDWPQHAGMRGLARLNGNERLKNESPAIWPGFSIVRRRLSAPKSYMVHTKYSALPMLGKADIRFRNFRIGVVCG